MGDVSHLIVVKEWNGKFTINDVYRAAAEKLCKKFPELQYVPVASILFVDNVDGSGKDRNKVLRAKISKIPDKWQDILKQFTDCYFLYMIEFYRKNIEELSWSQIVLELYRQLRHIDASGDLIHPEFQEWATVLYNIDSDWAGKNRIINNLLEDGVTFENLRMQTRLWEDQSHLRLVK